MSSVLHPVCLSSLDEERFGIRTARASQVTLDSLPSVLNFCLRNDVRLLIARCDASGLRVAQAMEAEGFSLMDTLLYYACHLTRLDIPQDCAKITVRPIAIGEEEKVKVVAAKCFRNYLGHYHADARLDRSKCDEVYVSWAIRSCLSRDVADEVLVADRGGRIVGFAALRLNSKEEGEGVLFGVDPAVQRQGIYRSLLIRSLQWCLSKGTSRMLYSTQLANFGVQRVLTRVGFEPTHACYTFHKWFDKEACASRQVKRHRGFTDFSKARHGGLGEDSADQ